MEIKDEITVPEMVQRVKVFKRVLDASRSEDGMRDIYYDTLLFKNYKTGEIISVSAYDLLIKLNSDAYKFINYLSQYHLNITSLLMSTLPAYKGRVAGQIARYIRDTGHTQLWRPIKYLYY